MKPLQSEEVWKASLNVVAEFSGALEAREETRGFGWYCPANVGSNSHCTSSWPRIVEFSTDRMIFRKSSISASSSVDQARSSLHLCVIMVWCMRVSRG